jgi:heme/copper-type cytochrome/quinol oxidase subunit 2
MLPTQACTMRVLANQLLWHNFWLYSSTQPDYKLSDVRSHTSGSSNNYLLTKLVLLSSAKDRELLRIQRSSSSFTPDLGNTQLLSNKLKFFVNAALVSQPATYRSVTLGGVASLKPEVLTNLLTNLASNLTKIRARSAYEFTRCDVGSMKRLRVTKGICLPADYPIHVICGSKDVVHSWAIPGLGIKIDCIPGYNSHRRVMFR